ncbi:oxidoreductase [Mycobacterium palustre]|nr:oxidoreductase [Mycobacterium palustre]
MFKVLSLGGYVAFDLPRVITGLGAVLLLGIAATHVCLLLDQEAPPWYLVLYAAAVIAGCLLIAGGLAIGRNPRVTQGVWFAGSLLSAVVLVVDVATRMASLPGLVSVTGRWDLAPATFALGFACAFIGVHGTVLLGINVAYPQRQRWED